jgi:hypothetical protein
MFKLFGKRTKNEISLPIVQTLAEEKNVASREEKPVTPLEENVLAQNIVNESGVLQKFIKSVFEGNDTNIKRLSGEIRAMRVYTPEEIRRFEKYEVLGFSGKPDYVEYKNLLRNREELEAELKARQYYDRKYPFNKFILDKQLQKIMGKYNLLIDTVDNYIGDIPEKNLEDMIRFKIDKRDLLSDSSKFRETNRSSNVFTPYPKAYEEMKEKWFWEAERWKLRILAPAHMFKEGRGKKNATELSRQLEKDPIVVCPVNKSPNNHSKDPYSGNLIVTAWGLEALDSMIFDQKMN